MNRWILKGAWLGMGVGCVLLGTASSASAGLYGYCSTRVASDRVCTEVTEFSASDSLLERCAPWARWVEGQGWSYRNSQDRKALEEEHAKTCVRTVPLDSGTPHSCWAVVTCPSKKEEPRVEKDLGMTMRAYDRANALIRCSKAAGPQYLAWLVTLAKEAPAECSLSMEVKPQTKRE